MLGALAFDHLDDVKSCFRMILTTFPTAFMLILDYFNATYVHGLTAVGRREFAPPRYPPKICNLKESVEKKLARRNNLSERWHNRFRIVVGKVHPSLYSFIGAMKKKNKAIPKLYSEKFCQAVALEKEKLKLRKRKETNCLRSFRIMER